MIFPWQSWSPIITNFFHLPSRDYCPIKKIHLQNQKPNNFKLKPKITGWCSWYAFGPNISHQLILHQAKIAQKLKLKLNYFLIDDGWCLLGDWLNPNSQLFPEGIDALSRQIQKNGFQTGLWLAPFLVHSQSRIFQSHPDWIIRNKYGRPVDGWKITPLDWLSPFKKFVLDFSKTEVQQYVYSCLDTIIKKWQIKFLKLDFLYAPYFDPRLTNDLQPHQYLQKLFSYIKTNYPDVYVLASGCPYKPAKYLVDAISISKDITMPDFYRFPFIRNLIHQHRLKLLEENFNVLKKSRRFFHLYPDVLITNPKSGASPNTVKRLLKIHCQCHISFLGDDLSSLAPWTKICPSAA